MENRDILIDTSIIIEFLRKQNKQLSYLWKIKEAGFNCLISTITVFELYAGAITKRHKKRFKQINEMDGCNTTNNRDSSTIC